MTELKAAEDRQSSQLCVSKTRQQRKHYSDVIGQAKNHHHHHHHYIRLFEVVKRNRQHTVQK